MNSYAGIPQGGFLIMAYMGGGVPQKGTFFNLQLYERAGISQVGVYETLGKSVI